jgi:hypothetical protein
MGGLGQTFAPFGGYLSGKSMELIGAYCDLLKGMEANTGFLIPSEPLRS